MRSSYILRQRYIKCPPYSLKLTMQVVQSVTRPDTAGYRWRKVAGTVTKVATDAIVRVV